MTDTVLASESTHWYAPDGTPAYEVTGANGKIRPATLRDARKLGLYPGVTTIIKAAASPGLDIWKQQQVMLAALTLQRKLDETDKDFIARVMHDSKEEARVAAERGQRVHASIEQAYLGWGTVEFPDAVAAFREALTAKFGSLALVFNAEKPFGCDLGYGGKVDLHHAELLVDIKTKDAVDADDLSLYGEHLMQLAAYRHGLGLAEDTRCAIAFVARAAPWKVCIIEADPAELRRGWQMFRALLEYWKASKNYFPTSILTRG